MFELDKIKPTENVIFVQDTPNLSSFTTANHIVESPSILVLVDFLEENICGIDTTSILVSDNTALIEEFTNEVQRQITKPNLIKGSDLNRMVKNNLMQTTSQYVLTILNSLTLISMFSYLIIVSYLSLNKKMISIHYVHGLSRLKRYEKLSYITTISVLISFIIVSLQNFRSNPLFGQGVNALVIMVIGVAVIFIDLVLVFFLVSDFEKNNVSEVLKSE